MSSAVPVVAGSVSTGVEVEFVGSDGVRSGGDLGFYWDFPFDRAAPIRAFPSFKGQRNFTGWWWMATTGTHVGYESWLERDNLMLLDADPDVVAVASQPFRLSWAEEPAG